MSASKKIVIVCYTFPPNPGIGGRRWAKFSKELIRNGHNVKVVTFNSGDKKTSSEWSKDIITYQNRIQYFPSKYPKWLTAPHSFFEKIMYRLSLMYVKLFAKGNYYDRASFLRKKVIHEVQEHINSGYTNVIVTCAPFKLAYWVSELIKSNPKVNFVVDFRDPWANNLTAYGFNEMSQERIDYERKAEETVVTKFNKIFVVADEMKNYFVQRYNLPNDKFEVISNGFDVDDFAGILETGTESYFKKSQKKKVVFTGTFYDNALYLLEELCEVLNKSMLLKNSFEFHFFGTASNGVKNAVAKNPDSLFFHGNVKLDEVYKIIHSADFCSLFLTDDITYSLSTKFLEYLSQKKQILVFSKGGATGNFVENYNLGFSISSKQMESKLIKCLSNSEVTTGEKLFSIDDYNVKNLTQKIVSHLR